MTSIKHSIEGIIKHVKVDFFTTFNNTEDFPELSDETAHILKDFGVPNNDKFYPFMTTDGVLKRLDSNLVQIGLDIVNNPFCIDTTNQNLVLLDKGEENSISICNSSIKKYIEVQHASIVYDFEIELPEVYGKYWDNHKIYAQKLREMLEAVEPDIMKYEI